MTVHSMNELRVRSQVVKEARAQLRLALLGMSDEPAMALFTNAVLFPSSELAGMSVLDVLEAVQGLGPKKQERVLEAAGIFGDKHLDELTPMQRGGLVSAVKVLI